MSDVSASGSSIASGADVSADIPRTDVAAAIGSAPGVSPGPNTQRRPNDALLLQLAAEITSTPQLSGPVGGLAEQLMLFVSPTLRHPEVLAPGRIGPLLHMIKSLMPDDDSDLSALALQALEEEIANHEELEERRAAASGG